MTKHIWTVLLVVLMVWGALRLHLDPAHAQSIGSGNGIAGQGTGSGSSFGSAVQKGNGTGGFAAAVAGTDYTAPNGVIDVAAGSCGGTAIQTALTAAAANAARTLVRLPANATCAPSAALTLDARYVSLDGRGAKLDFSAITTGTYLSVTGGSSNPPLYTQNTSYIQNLEIGGSGSSNSATGLLLGTATTRAEGVNVHDVGTGISFDAANTYSDSLYNVEVWNTTTAVTTGSDAPSQAGETINWFQGTIFNSATGVSMLNSGNGFSFGFHGTHFDGLTGSAFVLATGASETAQVRCYDCHIEYTASEATTNMVQLGGSNQFTAFEFYGGNIQTDAGNPSINSIVNATGSGLGRIYNPFISISGSYNSGGGAVIGASAGNVLVENGYNGSGTPITNGTSNLAALNVGQLNGHTPGGTAPAHNFATNIDTSARPSYAQPADADLALTDITTNNVSSTAHGFAPKLPNDATKFLNGAGAYTVPAGGAANPGGTATQLQLNSSGTAFAGAALYDTGTKLNPQESISFSPDTTGTNTNILNANTAAWIDPASFGASYLTTTATISSISGATITTTATHDFLAKYGVYIPHGGAAGTLGGVALSAITVPAPTVQFATCDQGVSAATTHTSSSSASIDAGLFFQANMEPLVNAYSSSFGGTYTYSGGVYTWATADGYYPMVSCYAMATPTAGAHTMNVKVALLDGNGGITPASAAGSLGSVAWVLPTATNPGVITEQIPGYTASHAYSLGDMIQPTDTTAYPHWVTATAYAAGKIVSPATNGPPNGGLFKAASIAGTGTSGGSEPVWGSFTAGCPNYNDYCLDGTGTVTTTACTPTGNSICWQNIGRGPLYVVTTSGTSGSEPTFGATCPASSNTCTSTAVFTNIGQPVGWLFYENIDGGTYFLADVVLANQRTIDWGTSATYAGYGYLEFGSDNAASAEDMPATPPGSALNDDFFSTVSSVPASNQMTLAASPNSSATGSIYHDDTPAWNSLQTYCRTFTVDKGCRVKVRPGITRVSTFNQTTDMDVEGQEQFASEILLFGSTYAYSVSNEALGGQWQNFTNGGAIELRDLQMVSDNTSGDAIVHACCHWTQIKVENIQIKAANGTYIRRGFQMSGGEGIYWGVHGSNLDNDFTCGNCNGLYIGPGYSAWYQGWPGLLLYPAIMYDTSGQGPWEVIGATGENVWNFIGPGNASIAGGGGYLQGITIESTDTDDIGGTNSGIGTFLNAVGSGVVNPQGTFYTLNSQYTGVVSQNGNTVGAGNANNIGCVWGQSFVTGSQLAVRDFDCPAGRFGVITDAPADIRNSTFAGLQSAVSGVPWSGIGIGLGTAGSSAEQNIVQGASSGTGIVGYLIGYAEDIPTNGCETGDPYTVRFNTGATWAKNLNTTLNVCSTANIEPGYQMTTLSSTASGSGDTLTPAANFKCTNQEVTMTAADTITLAKPAYANQCELVRVCQNGTGGFAPTFAQGSGLTITGTFPACTTTANKCCDFQLVFDAAGTAYISGVNAGPL